MSEEISEKAHSDQPAPEPITSDRSQKLLKITPNELCDFLNDVAPGKLCNYCGKAEYSVPADPKGKSAAVVTTPVPHVKGVGAWLYMVTCQNCGHTEFFHAHTVADKLIGD